MGGGRDLEKKKLGLSLTNTSPREKAPKTDILFPFLLPPRLGPKATAGSLGFSAIPREEIPPLKLLLPDPSLIPRGLLSACTDQ